MVIKVLDKFEWCKCQINFNSSNIPAIGSKLNIHIAEEANDFICEVINIEHNLYVLNNNVDKEEIIITAKIIDYL